MTSEEHPKDSAGLRESIGKFWAGDLGLTLVTAAVAVLVFVVTPLREAGVPGRVFVDLVVLALMASGAVAVKQSRLSKVFLVVAGGVCGAVLAAGRLHSTPLLHELGSVLVTVTLILYIRIVLLVVFQGGAVTWNRIHGGVCAYLLMGMAWASAFQFVEQVYPGSFRFVSIPADIDQMTSKLTYFSFATLTTVGSDIVPVHPFARSLTIAEAVTGQLFPVILISTLVALAIQSQTKS